MTEQNKNQVSFRMIKASEEDYKYCYTLYENNMKKIIEQNMEYKPDIFKANFRVNEIRMIEEKESGEFIGFFQIQYKKDLTYIKEIQIQGHFQNTGYELQILKVIQKEAEENKLPKIEMNMKKDYYLNEIFENFGFKIVKELKNSNILSMN
ncbi:MAG: GNAT family N-acetyltransferase [Nanoarchaeales archaeon]|nr:GNAT family N-acetyltransferase [Nanoarchaeales archaeon]